jgi:uncharacterized protein (TIGR02679 family)
MNSAADLPRLRATLGDPRLTRLLTLLRRRLEQGLPLTGRATLGGATPAERAAVDELFGRRPTTGASLTIDLDLLASQLHAACICNDLVNAVQILAGPIDNRRAARETREQAWSVIHASADLIGVEQPLLRAWLTKLMASGVLKRLAQDDPKQAAALIGEIGRIAKAFPAAAEPLASFAARLFGDAHALDPGTPRATLAVRAAARVGGIHFEDDAEGRRAAWASVGVMCDELSTPVLVLNLVGTNETPLTRLLRSACADTEPLHVSLRLLLRWPLANDPAINGRQIFVCENPTIVALAAARLGQECAPLVCVNGQFATPSLVLLRQLRAAGAQLWYHGDFDPAGLAIARRAMAESGARPWRFCATDYASAPKGVKFSGSPGSTPWDETLREAMRVDGRTVHEEAVFSALAEDLAE